MVRQRVTDPDTTALSSWVKAVTQGGLVTCSGKRMALDPGIHSGYQVELSPDFMKKHTSLADAMRTGTAAKNSKGRWAVNSGKAGKNVHEIDKKRDMVNFLLHARRVAVGSDISGLARSL